MWFEMVYFIEDRAGSLQVGDFAFYSGNKSMLEIFSLKSLAGT